jgi:hypothetical protein
MSGLLDALGVSAERATAETLGAIFRSRTAEEWERWAAERDLPVLAVRGLH